MPRQPAHSARALRFHAAPPSGEWFNDPVGLIRHEGQWRLFVQHRADAPHFRATGWARLSSPDLLRWRYDGPVIPADGTRWAYSGCLVPEGDALLAFHTLHDDGHEEGHERQVRARSADGGSTWRAEPLRMPPQAEGRNRRDPFVAKDADGGWTMLLAHPADWNGWAAGPASEVHSYRSDEGAKWRHDGLVARAPAPGLLWEMPVALAVEGEAVELVSEVDRREGGATGRVLARCGEGAWQPLDWGPDFYAAIPAGRDRAPGVVVAWGSSWQTARLMDWPGFSGGPIALPRALALVGDGADRRVGQRPAVGATGSQPAASGTLAGLARVEVAGGLPVALAVETAAMTLEVSLDPASGAHRCARRGRDPRFDWLGTGGGVVRAERRELLAFYDGGLLEVFDTASALAWTIACPGGAPSRFMVTADGAAQALLWHLPPG